MKKLLLLLFLFHTLKISATHIVGGEFELEHLEGYNYQLRLIQYFDDFYGNPSAEDIVIQAFIYQKSNNNYIRSVSLQNRGSSDVPYTNIACTKEELQTRRILYEANIYLSPDIYNDPAGYYVIWERCCRNNVITNIQLPESVGQAFYLEFPPVVKNGRPFYNSSPILFPPLSDYGCVNKFYYVDFQGIDPDGDSLVYSLVDPLVGVSSPDEPAPPPSPAPYQTVAWQTGITRSNMVPGNPALAISAEGLLTVTPSQEGLFVFSVQCLEFRNGEKIGEVRRDFQMLVLDCPAPGSRPSVQVKLKGSDQFYDSTDTIRFSPTQEKCFTVYVTDNDGAENIRFKAVPVNFSGSLLDSLLEDYSGVVGQPDDTLTLDICLPDCPLLPDNVAIFDLVALDNECPQPLMDSVRMIVDIENANNVMPYFTSSSNLLTTTISEGETFNFTLTGVDEDQDALQLDIKPLNFNLEDYGIRFLPLKNEPGQIEYYFSFDSDCQKYQFNDGEVFELLFLLSDNNSCNVNRLDTTRLEITISVPDNNPPLISTNLTDNQANVRIDQTLSFNVFGTDQDNDLLELTAYGLGFELSDLGMVFDDAVGFGQVSSTFTWRPTCDFTNLDPNQDYTVAFVVEDNDACSETSADTVLVTINLRPPRNNSPQIGTDIFEFQTIRVLVGQTLEFNVAAFDADGDSVFLDLADREMLAQTLNVQFEPASGTQRAFTSFSWTPQCEHLNPDFTGEFLEFKFAASDDKCYNSRTDTVTINVVYQDVPGEYEAFLPPNIFTPNQDGVNEYFEVPDLPKNNCRSEFQHINIFNRWGDLVYSSANREFQWSAQDNPNGIYYYIIQFRGFEYKGTITVMR